jgi:hypothetical protein
MSRVVGVSHDDVLACLEAMNDAKGGTESQMQAALLAFVERKNPWPMHPQTSYGSRFKPHPGATATVMTHGVRLACPGAEVIIDLQEMDEELELGVSIVKNERPLFFNVDGYEYGYRNPEGKHFATTEDEDGEE